MCVVCYKGLTRGWKTGREGAEREVKLVSKYAVPCSEYYIKKKKKRVVDTRRDDGSLARSRAHEQLQTRKTAKSFDEEKDFSSFLVYDDGGGGGGGSEENCVKCLFSVCIYNTPPPPPPKQNRWLFSKRASEPRKKSGGR